jgi:predicted pyridoxine 5'-phosphate oxidase superfamily flavin-nucleotide-binding protein
MMITSATNPTFPWHAGEIALQTRAGVTARMADMGPRVIRTSLIDQHRAFYPLLSFAVMGTVDPAGNVWATIRAGEPGFLHAPDPLALAVDMPREAQDPADAGMDDGDAVGLLGIDLRTRRRNRLNGAVRRTDGRGFAIDVEQSYGNCPRYIQPRTGTFTRPPDAPSSATVEVSRRLDERARKIIANADTFFVATYVDLEDGQRQVDVSHRGGNPGFVQIGDDGVLTIPDYAGNSFFNTLGNIVANPRAGLVFLDFSTGDMLQMTGSAAISLHAADAAGQETDRHWRFMPSKVIFRPAGLPLRFSTLSN